MDQPNDRARRVAQLLVLGAIGMGIRGATVDIGAQSMTTNLGQIYAAAPVFIILLGRILLGERLAIAQGVGVALVPPDICLATQKSALA